MPHALPSPWDTVSEQDNPCSREMYDMSSEGGDQKISEQRNECDDSYSVVAIKVMAAHSQGWQVDASC